MFFTDSIRQYSSPAFFINVLHQHPSSPFFTGILRRCSSFIFSTNILRHYVSTEFSMHSCSPKCFTYILQQGSLPAFFANILHRHSSPGFLFVYMLISFTTSRPCIIMHRRNIANTPHDEFAWANKWPPQCDCKSKQFSNVSMFWDIGSSCKSTMIWFTVLILFTTIPHQDSWPFFLDKEY